LRIAALALTIMLGACGPSTPPNVKGQQRGSSQDIGGVLEDEKFKEIETVLPALPQEANLIEFKPRQNSSNRFYIDRNSVTLGADRVVRYSAVIKGSAGAINTSYEGIHCKTAQFKVFAFGTDAGTWAGARDPHWQPIQRLDSDYRFGLYKDYFCYGNTVNGRNARDLIAVLVGNPLNNITDKDRF
jgi:hypothetical protein